MKKKHTPKKTRAKKKTPQLPTRLKKRAKKNAFLVDPTKISLVQEKRQSEIKNSTISHLKKLLSNLCISFGIFLLMLCTSQLISRYNPRRVSFTNYTSPLEKACVETAYFPKSITIPQIGVDLPIIPAQIVNKTWETTAHGVSYLRSSPVPGEKGNSILYGHNWESLLGSLRFVKPGQSITIEYTNGMKRRFVIQTMANVNPNQVEVLRPSTDKRITLYTCTGFMDSQRLVVVATLESEVLAQSR